MKWIVGWGAVAKCNMKCQFCYSQKVRAEEHVLSYNDWISFISSNGNHIESINYGTGENTMVDEWFDLIKYIADEYPQIKQALTTNGYISQRIKKDPEKAQKFFSSIQEVDVSLDFSEKEKHNAFRGNQKAHDWALDTIKICRDRNIEVTIVFIGTNNTLEENNLRGLFEIARKYDVKLRMNLFRPTNGINNHSKRFITSYEKIINALKWINDNHTVLSIDDALFSAILTDNPKVPNHNNSLRILHDGSITPSTYLISKEFRTYNITEGSVLQKISDSGWGIKPSIPDECTQCKYVERCGGGVYDRRYLWYGTFEKRDPYCPYLNANDFPNFKIKNDPMKTVSSIHHGYLPTMFFGY